MGGSEFSSQWIHWGGIVGDETDHFAYWSTADGVNWTLDGESDGEPPTQFEDDNNLLIVSTAAGLIRLNRKPSSPDGFASISVDGVTTWRPVQNPPSECHGGVYGESRLGATRDFLYCSSNDGLWIGHFTD